MFVSHVLDVSLVRCNHQCVYLLDYPCWWGKTHQSPFNIQNPYIYILKRIFTGSLVRFSLMPLPLAVTWASLHFGWNTGCHHLHHRFKKVWIKSVHTYMGIVFVLAVMSTHLQPYLQVNEWSQWSGKQLHAEKPWNITWSYYQHISKFLALCIMPLSCLELCMTMKR